MGTLDSVPSESVVAQRDALVEGGPLTSAELAARAGTHERYAREWAEQQAVGGILSVDDERAAARERRFRFHRLHP